MNFDKKPLPRFWYLPRSLAAVVVMTGDDHGSFYNGGATAARFDQFLAASPQDCVVDNWECVRGTAYLFPPSVASNPLTDSQAATYINNGFEISVHVDSIPDCSDWTPASLDAAYTSDLNSFASEYSSVPAPETHRIHCVSWSDYDSQPKTELSHGIRLDTNYYYFPPTWVNDRPGLFTGSGIPMRFADIGGNLINVYQATTQLTDESGQTYPFTIDTLLDRANGPEGYYGVFVANMHNDETSSSGADAIIASAQARGIPVVSARQMLTWLDGRNASVFRSLTWNGSTLSFSISAAPGANGLVAMVPVADHKTVTNMTYNGNPFTSFTMVRSKGIQYARFSALTGDYVITYAVDNTPPDTTILTHPSNPSYLTSAGFTFSATEDGSTFECKIDGDGFSACSSPKTYSSLANGLTHTFEVRATDLAGNTDPSPAIYSWTIDIQTISFPLPPVKIYGDADFAPGASASTGLAVTYSSLDLAVATITMDGKIHIVGAGATTITASQPGDGTYSPAVPVDRLLTVNKATPIVSLASSSPTSTFGDVVTFTATVSSTTSTPTGTVTFKEGGTTLGTGILSGGMATYDPSTLSVGNHVIAAAYSGDAKSRVIDFVVTYPSVNKVTATVKRQSPFSGTTREAVRSMSKPPTALPSPAGRSSGRNRMPTGGSSARVILTATASSTTSGGTAPPVRYISCS